MSNQIEQVATDDLLTAYREGRFSHEELIEAAGPDLGALAEESPEAAIRLVGTFGGVDVWVPVNATEGTSLRSMLDESDFRAIATIYGGCRLKVPSLKPLKLALRRRKIAGLREAGWKLSELARHFQVSDRQILNILKRHREEELA